MATKAAAKSGAKKEAPASGSTGNYVVFARRFRPQSFADVVGQETVTNALRQALRTGRLAQAYLLCGPRGVGKTSLARIFAKALSCLNGKGPQGVADEPCNDCAACAAIQNGSALDVIEMDAATNRGIEEVRRLRDSVGLAPSQLRYKVYIVDEVHMLTTEAWNAFLKTLEEPPPHVKFVFATTDPDKIPETIVSRCQRFDLKRITLAGIVARLKQICEIEGLEAETGALERIAGISRGGLRDAEGLLDQAVNLGEGKVTEEVVRQISGAAPDELIFEVLSHCAQGRAADALQRCGQALEAGADPGDLLDALAERLRGTLLAKTCGANTPLLEGQSHLATPYKELGAVLSEDQLLMLIQLFLAARRQLKDAALARLPLELAIVRAARAKELVDLGKLVSALESGAAPRPAAAASPPPMGSAPRPNSAGRPAGVVDAPPAAAPVPVRSAPPVSAPVASTPARSAPPVAAPAAKPVAPEAASAAGREAPERWNEVLEQVRAKNGGTMIVSYLNHAQSLRLDAAAGTLELGYTTSQLFYQESLAKPERLNALGETLAEIYGKPIEVRFVRASATPGQASRALPALAPVTLRAPVSGPPAPPKPAQPVPSTNEDSPFQDEGDDAGFVDAGTLPLPEAVTEESGDVPVSEDDEDTAPPAASVPPPKAVAKPTVEARAPGPNDKELLAHPLLKAVCEQFQGEVIRVEKRTRQAGGAGEAKR